MAQNADAENTREVREFTRETLADAAKVLRAGGILMVPTDTVNGLCCRALDERAVLRLFELKRRPFTSPLSICLADTSDIAKYTLPVAAGLQPLISAALPGKATLVFEKKPVIPGIVTGGGRSVGVRIPDCDILRELIRLIKEPLALTSANEHGKTEMEFLAESRAFFQTDNAKKNTVALPVVSGVLLGENSENDGAELAVVPSTVIDCTLPPPRILRRGALTKKAVIDLGYPDTEGVTVIGITGPTGAGKTTLLNELLERGATVCDCDRIYAELLRYSLPMLTELASAFPGAVTDGVVDRKRLSEIVFSDKKALTLLNKITHKYVLAEVCRTIAFVEKNGLKQLVAADAIELHESRIAGVCDETIAVLAPKRDRIRRICARDGIDAFRARARVNAQKKDAFYIENCDYSVKNDGTAQEFKDKCALLLDDILKRYN
ncbi:MAG: threonylcarbamoyl-AMP synthase [Oscillospiraceae bacterium]|jgi:tRNA threonylcarbamoyl adenosine modification protein (Sua5/YciO/YrdC/YwlC family)/dephospho-CoA kinase|nr:threonylcarbamoyl-AMP synthase [Oscillospiraceae bacterium]